jgi:signal transduction histidine kinase
MKGLRDITLNENYKEIIYSKNPKVVCVLNVLAKLNKELVTVASVGISALIQFSFWEIINHAIFVIYMPSILISSIYGKGKQAIALAIAASHFITASYLSYPLKEVIERNTIFLLASGIIYYLANNMLKNMEEIKRTMEIRTNFFSMVSHELKTPLTALKLRHQMKLKRMSPEDKEYRYTSDNLASINSMTRLIRDMLDVTRIESNRLGVNLEDKDIAETIKRAISNVEITMPPDRVLYIDHIRSFIMPHDPMRIEQVVENLINNAIKHGEGRIDVQTYFGYNFFKIIVSDQGKIDSTKLSSIFEKYTTSDVGHGGLGLGLYITRSIIEEHHGRIRVENTYNTKFIVTLPR